MLRVLGSVLVLSVWLAFFFIDIADDLGLIDAAGDEVADSVDSVLADFGEAIKISQRSQGGAPDMTSPRLALADLSLHSITRAFVTPADSFGLAIGETPPNKKHSNLHRLHQVFLI